MTIRKLSLASPIVSRKNSNFTKIVITSDFGSIIGQMKEKFKFDLNAEWAPLFANLIPGADFLQKTGDASLTTGVFSRKYYKGGGYLKINTSFRILENGDNNYSNVIYAAKILSSLLVPNSLNAIKSGGAINTKAKSSADDLGNLLKKVAGGDVSFQDVISTGEQLLKNITGNGRTVSLIIGDFFNCNRMIITDVSSEYSKEVTHIGNGTGPLYGDFSVSFETLESVTRDGTGTASDYNINNILTGNRFKVNMREE